MAFPPNHVLLIGATSGIGAAMAERFAAGGSKVTVVGRRKDRLDAFVEKHGKDKASSVPFDITDAGNMDAFVSTIATQHADIDYVVLNAGTQNPVPLSNPKAVDLAKFHAEVNVNFSSFVNLTVKLLPFLMAKQSTIVFIGTHLSFIPATGVAAYSCSKAALSTFALCLRDQLRESSVKVVDVWPPVVQSELHDYLGVEKGRSFGMPAVEFVDKAFEGLIKGDVEVLIGEGLVPEDIEKPMVAKRRELTELGAEKMRKMYAAMAAKE